MRAPSPKNPYYPQIVRGGSTQAPRPLPTMMTPANSSTSLASLLGMQAQGLGAQRGIPSLAISPNFESDPILARINALKGQNVANARSQAAALRKQAIIDSGLDDVGGGIGLDAGTLQAARENPFSSRRKIQEESIMRGRDLDEGLNQGNLFFSGERVNRLSELAQNTAEANTGLGRTLQELLGGIDAGVMSVEQEEAERVQAALEQAAAEQRMQALMQAYIESLTGGSYGGGTVTVREPLTIASQPVPTVAPGDVPRWWT